MSLTCKANVMGRRRSMEVNGPHPALLEAPLLMRMPRDPWPQQIPPGESLQSKQPNFQLMIKGCYFHQSGAGEKGFCSLAHLCTKEARTKWPTHLELAILDRMPLPLHQWQRTWPDPDFTVRSHKVDNWLPPPLEQPPPQPVGDPLVGRRGARLLPRSSAACPRRRHLP